MTIGSRQSAPVVEAQGQSQDYLWSSPSAPQARRMPGAVVFLIAVALVGAVGMLYLLQTNHVANLGYEMSGLQAEREAALVEQQQLSAQIAEKQALPSIESAARVGLGMRPIGAHVFLDVELPPDEAVATPGPAPKEHEPALERFWKRLTGASSEAQEPTQDD